MPKCNNCGFSGSMEKFSACLSPYHDCRCPECGTTAVDTSDINKEWAARGEEYGYGDNNCLMQQLSPPV